MMSQMFSFITPLAGLTQLRVCPDMMSDTCEVTSNPESFSTYLVHILVSLVLKNLTDLNPTQHLLSGSL